MADGYKGQPLSMEAMLPASMSMNDIYVFIAGLAGLMVVFAIGNMVSKMDHRSAKLRSLQERRAQLRGELLGRNRRKRRRMKQENSMNLMRRVVNKFELLKSSQVKEIQNLLIEAGFRSKDAIVIFMFFTLVLPIVLGLLGLLAMSMDIWGQGMMAKIRMASPILGAYIGLKLPIIVVSRTRKKRYIMIQRALSDTLDLMTICAEAGLSLGQSLQRVSKELGPVYPQMAEELALTAMELGFLPERKKALMNLAERAKMPEIKGITSVLIQTEKYGTPIAQALRVLSKEFRTQRMLRAENKAARLPALMTVPMILFILPTMFIIVIAPAAIQVSDSF